MSSISIVIPAFNSEPYVDGLLASILAQDDPPDEVVVVDDCSTDATVERLEAWKDRLPLRIVRQATNGGVSVASNAGLEAATCDFAMMVGHDDLLLPNHVAVHRSLARPGRIVAARVYHWRPSSGLRVPEATRLPSIRRQPTAILRSHFLSAFVTMERHSFLALGYRTDLLEDWDLAIRAIRTGLHGIRPREFTYLYRVHADNLAKAEAKSDAAVRLLQHLADNETLRPAERRALGGGLRRIRAGSMLASARQSAAEGRWLAARTEALGAFARGSAANRLRAAPVILTPRLENRLRRRLLRLDSPDPGG